MTRSESATAHSVTRRSFLAAAAVPLIIPAVPLLGYQKKSEPSEYGRMFEFVEEINRHRDNRVVDRCRAQVGYDGNKYYLHVVIDEEFFVTDVRDKNESFERSLKACRDIACTASTYLLNGWKNPNDHL